MITHFDEHVDERVALDRAVQVVELRARVQRQVQHANAPLAADRRVQECHLHQHAVRLAELVVVPALTEQNATVDSRCSTLQSQVYSFKSIIYTILYLIVNNTEYS